jgi:hypothetical protein
MPILKFNCESATYPVFRDYKIFAPADKEINLQLVAMKDFTGGTVKLEVINPVADPLIDTDEEPLFIDEMQDTKDIWCPLELKYRNLENRELIVRITAINASGAVRFKTTELEKGLNNWK